MKRSEINNIIRQSDDFIKSFGFCLPPFAYWSVNQFRAQKTAAHAIIEAGLGWDITDYGAGDFDALGLFLFTTRNGSQADLSAGGGMCYAEKIMISRHDQISPMHCHVLKTEDIINRGGATLAVEMFESDLEGNPCTSSTVKVMSDGILNEFVPGGILRLEPGASVTLRPGNWHKFWGEKGDVLIGEVSAVNDDNTDNIFADPIGRFSTIEEDEVPLHLLVPDYDVFLAD
jgi:D-lyxose ketol-isomerase